MEIGSGVGYASGPVIGGYLYLVLHMHAHAHNTLAAQCLINTHLIIVLTINAAGWWLQTTFLCGWWTMHTM